MSATNRGGERSEADFYRTAKWPVQRLLERCELPGGEWLELGAGEGDICRSVNALRPGDVCWTAVELREECRPKLQREAERVFIGNAVGATKKWLRTRSKFSVSLGNPPFRWAIDFIHASLRLARWTALLLRLDFLATADRCEFMQRNTPDVYVLPDRISFTGNGSTDSTDHCWMVWGPKRVRRAGRLVVLDTTPLEVRKTQLKPPMAVTLPSQAALFDSTTGRAPVEG